MNKREKQHTKEKLTENYEVRHQRVKGDLTTSSKGCKEDHTHTSERRMK